jgi:hypothetical protein
MLWAPNLIFYPISVLINKSAKDETSFKVSEEWLSLQFSHVHKNAGDRSWMRIVQPARWEKNRLCKRYIWTINTWTVSTLDAIETQ